MFAACSCLSFHPQVLWYQTLDSVIVTVKLTNPGSQHCDFYPDRVVYRCVGSKTPTIAHILHMTSNIQRRFPSRALYTGGSGHMFCSMPACL